MARFSFRRNKEAAQGPRTYGFRGEAEEQNLMQALAYKLAPWKEARALPSNMDFTRLALEGYTKHQIIHAAVKEIARSTAEPKLVALGPVNARGNRRPLPAGHRLARLLARPNSMQTIYELLEDVVTNFQVAGNGFFHKVRNKQGEIVELESLNPGRMEPVGSRTGLQRWVYTVSGTEATLIPVGDVIQIRTPNPNMEETFWGLSPIKVCSGIADLDTMAIEHLRSFFANNAIPSAVVTLKRKTTPQQRREIKQQWVEEHGQKKSGGLAVIEEGAAEFTVVGSRPDQLKLDSIFDQTETRVLSVFGVPAIIVGSRIGLFRSTLANYDAAMRQFWIETLRPMYTRLAGQLTLGLQNEFSEDIEIIFDLTHVDGLQPSLDQRVKWASQGWDKGLLTHNEARALMGQPTKRGGDVFKRPSNVEYVKRLDEETEDPGTTEPKGTTSQEEEEQNQVRRAVRPRLQIIAGGVDAYEDGDAPPHTLQESA